MFQCSKLQSSAEEKTS